MRAFVREGIELASDLRYRDFLFLEFGNLDLPWRYFGPMATRWKSSTICYQLTPSCEPVENRFICETLFESEFLLVKLIRLENAASVASP